MAVNEKILQNKNENGFCVSNGLGKNVKLAEKLPQKAIKNLIEYTMLDDEKLLEYNKNTDVLDIYGIVASENF